MSYTFFSELKDALPEAWATEEALEALRYVSKHKLEEDWIPGMPLVFRALEKLRPEDCHVCIVGAEPYPLTNKSNGLAFGVKPTFRGGGYDTSWVLATELNGNREDLDVSLESWESQGVLLLNRYLSTTPEGKRHTFWYSFTQSIVNQLHPSTIFLLLGSLANSLDTYGPYVLSYSYPEAIGAKRTDKLSRFRGSGCFTSINSLLKGMGKEEIQWLKK